MTEDDLHCDLASTKLGRQIYALLEDTSLEITSMAQSFLLRAAWEQLMFEREQKV